MDAVFLLLCTWLTTFPTDFPPTRGHLLRQPFSPPLQRRDPLLLIELYFGFSALYIQRDDIHFRHPSAFKASPGGQGHTDGRGALLITEDFIMREPEAE